MDNAVKDELAIDECWIVEKENLVEAIKSLGYNVRYSQGILLLLQDFLFPQPLWLYHI
ncbi:hypothetical protein R83H12_02910 [Fibrobacteria bacterium R8-3-H12]